MKTVADHSSNEKEHNICGALNIIFKLFLSYGNLFSAVFVGLGHFYALLHSGLLFLKTVVYQAIHLLLLKTSTILYFGALLKPTAHAEGTMG